MFLLTESGSIDILMNYFCELSFKNCVLNLKKEWGGGVFTIILIEINVDLHGGYVST